MHGNYYEYKFPKQLHKREVLEWDFRNKEEINWDLEEVFENPDILYNGINKLLGLTKDYFMTDPQPIMAPDEFVSIVFEVNQPNAGPEKTTILMPSKDINFRSINKFNTGNHVSSNKSRHRSNNPRGSGMQEEDRQVDEFYKHWPPSNNFESHQEQVHKFETPESSDRNFEGQDLGRTLHSGLGSGFLDESGRNHDSVLKSALKNRGQESDRKKSVSMDIDITPIAPGMSHDSGFASSQNFGNNIDLMLIPLEDKSIEMLERKPPAQSETIEEEEDPSNKTRSVLHEALDFSEGPPTDDEYF